MAAHGHTSFSCTSPALARSWPVLPLHLRPNRALACGAFASTTTRCHCCLGADCRPLKSPARARQLSSSYTVAPDRSRASPGCRRVCDSDSLRAAPATTHAAVSHNAAVGSHAEFGAHAARVVGARRKAVCVVQAAAGASAAQVGESDRAGKSAALATAGEDTIAAIVTGASTGAVAIIRVSGRDTLDIVARVFRPGGRFTFDWRPESHRVYFGTAVDGDERPLDEVLLLPMLSPRSYTREDVAELHCHGGGTCVQRVLRACIEAGARAARPGEFTLRAFLNGRLDLTQAESILQLVQSRSAAAADSALAGLQGGVGDAVRQMRVQAIEILAEIEARLDFEEDLPAMDVERLTGQVEALQSTIEDALRTARQGSLLRNGLQVAIVGRPNVGKSSLLNAWTKTNRSIVTEIPGTTRDVLEAELNVGGVPLVLLDTAGIRSSTDVVERLGVERSQAAAVAADIVIMVVDAQSGWTSEDQAIYKSLWGNGPGSDSCRVRGIAMLVANKCDLAPDGPPSLPLLARTTFQQVVSTSAVQRVGLDQLDLALLKVAGAPQLASGGISWAVNERQADALVRAHESLMTARESARAGLPLDFWTIDLRGAVIALGEVSGDDVTEEVLDAVFSRFCLGK